MRSLETARRLEELPETQDAFRAGELSEAQASTIAAAASVDPSAEGRLLDKARGGASFRGLRDDCREAAVRARDDRKWAQHLHETRSVRTWTDEIDGAYRIEARLAPDVGVWIDSALRLKTDEIFQVARERGDRESLDAYRADAFAALMRGEAPAKPLEARLDADYAAIERGYVEEGERCELVGIGPIPVTLARGLLNDARITVLTREGSEITRISSPKRGIPVALRRWLDRAYPSCGITECGQTNRLQIDHIIPVEQHGPTSRDNTWKLCPHHHDLKTIYGWRVVTDPGGTRRLIPPDHPDPPDDPDPP
jgi:5-methylcytosine-specific restriction endonuclease McrA